MYTKYLHQGLREFLYTFSWPWSMAIGCIKILCNLTLNLCLHDQFSFNQHLGNRHHIQHFTCDLLLYDVRIGIQFYDNGDDVSTVVGGKECNCLIG